MKIRATPPKAGRQTTLLIGGGADFACAGQSKISITTFGGVFCGITFNLEMLPYGAGPSLFSVRYLQLSEERICCPEIMLDAYTTMGKRFLNTGGTSAFSIVLRAGEHFFCGARFRCQNNLKRRQLW